MKDTVDVRIILTSGRDITLEGLDHGAWTAYRRNPSNFQQETLYTPTKFVFVEEIAAAEVLG